MRNMAFSLTSDAIRDRTKTVTRRLGWEHLEPGTVLRAIVKGQGLKKGEHVEKLAVIRVVSVTRERVDAIRWRDVLAELSREGFPLMSSSAEFVAMFCKANGCATDALVNRIEFTYED